MATNKKQHYVPIFLLKNFSINNSGTHINVYNISRKIHYPNIPLRDQAYIDYYYGKDGLIEEAMTFIESENAKQLRYINETTKLPKFSTPDYHSLLFFTLIQNARTQYTGEEQLELVNKIKNNIASSFVNIRKLPDELEMRNDSPTLLALNAVSSSFEIAEDLRCKLLVNTLDESFILSDHPVVFYNQFLESKKIFGSKTGIALKGLEIFFPISPRHILIFYDSSVYKIGSAKQEHVFITKRNDITNLNGLQYVNANKSLFYNGNMKSSDIDNLSRDYFNYRRKKKSNCEVHSIQKQLFKNPSALIHIYKEDVECKLSLSFIKVLKKTKTFEPGYEAIPLRNELLCNEYKSKDAKGQGGMNL